ncbi:MFS transporter [Acuticoccus kandeliae]|uniref:MFS transporter n=1 Tax=Acuticoccus kandeliae TaxID=2073160 RepID=UPI000D3ED42B|nr:MFS transporter [Acuticoccus kandeliae]
MTGDRDADAPLPGGAPTSPWRLVRWLASSATMAVPVAAGPVAYSLVALSVIGDATGGAAIILAMTLAQVAGAVPVTRLGRTLPAATYLRLLVGFRTLALIAVALAAHLQAPFAVLVALAAVAGTVTGAAYGYLRPLLNHLTPPARLPRALGIAATLNELVFVLAPVAASGLGTVSPVFAVLALALVGGLPVLLIPSVGETHVKTPPQPGSSALSPAILLWLVCAAASGGTVASIEIGAVALALEFGYEPALAIFFTVPLCLASVSGGVWISMRNRMSSRRAVVAQFAIMSLGVTLAALGLSLTTTIVGAVLVGSVLAPLGTYYTLILDTLAPPHKRAEVFALLRTANAVGVIFASAVLTAASLSTALATVAVTMILVTSAVAFASFGRRGGS